MTLVEFLLARIAEDEALAREAATQGVFDADAYGECLSQQIADHAVNWNPARVLAECEAKRRIVERAQAALSIYDPSDPTAWIALYDLADLAKVYADHPDYGAVVGPPESATDMLAAGVACETCRATPARDRDIPGLRALRLCDACAKEYGAR